MIGNRRCPMAALAFLLSTGCDSAIVLDSNGTVQVAVSTRGLDPDPDGYSLAVDGREAYVLPAAGTLTLQLDQGSHSVQLGGLSDNCAVDGTNPRTIVLQGSGAVDVSFTVVCTLAPTGGFKIVVSTSGTGIDPDGYSLSVAGAQSRQIETEATEVFLGLTPGQHLITLKGIAEGCSLVGGNPRLATVVRGKTITVRLAVSCGAAGNPG